MAARQEMLASLGCRKTLNWQMSSTKSALQCSLCASSVSIPFVSHLMISQPLYSGWTTFEPHPAQDRPQHFYACPSHYLGVYCNPARWAINFWIDMITLANKRVDFIGFVTSFGGLVTVRVLLGLAEGPMAPCIVCYLSGFYTRKELALRFVTSILPSCFFFFNNLPSRIALFLSTASVCIFRVSCQIVLIPCEFCSSLARSRVC